jgi:hypothetical protein
MPLVGDSTSRPSFTPRAAGDYRLTLTGTSALGVVNTQTYTARVLNRIPSIASCPTEQGAANDVLKQISLAACIQDGDGASIVQIQSPSTLQWSSAVTTSVYQASVSGKVIDFTYALMATVPATLNYRVCDVDPNDCVSGQIAISIDSTLAVTDDLFRVCLPYDLPNTIAVVCDSVLPLAIPIDTLLQNDTVLPLNDAVTLAILGQPALGLVQPASGVRGESLEYSSSVVTCDINGNSIADGASPCDGDRFRYQLTASDDTESNEATVVITVRATTSFRQGPNSIHGTFAACQGCHFDDGTQQGSGADAWIRTANDPAATLASISAGGLLGGATPAGNLLYRAPCLGEAHIVALDGDQCRVLLQWMREGENLW